MILSSADKARGGVYTPEPIARFLADWAVRDPRDSVLEPSAGSGEFLRAANARLRTLGSDNPAASIHAIELDPAEAARCRAMLPGADVRELDFLAFDPTEVSPVSAVVGNPPFIRYQAFARTSRVLGLARGREQGVVLSKMASSWAHFVVHACSFLAPDGRLALVLPSELLTAQYAVPVWAFLTRRFRAVSVISFTDRIFEGVEVDALLLLADQGEPPAQRELRLPGIVELSGLPRDWRWSTSQVPTRRSARVFDERAEELYAEIRASGGFTSLGEIASVGIGVVTGANSYFVLTHEQREALGLPEKYTQRIVVRGRDVKGLCVRQGEERELLVLDDAASAEPTVAAYLADGLRQAIPARYKCTRRKRWFVVPLPRHRPDAFLSYMIHTSPRVIVARGAWSTNLLHGVTLTGGVPVEALAAGVLSSASQLSAEIEGRTYGGGVLKLEPTEAEQLLVPRFTPAVSEELAAASAQLHRLLLRRRPLEATALVDAMLGVDHSRLQQSVAALRAHRLHRRTSVRRDA